ncbi:PREDICTED: uncharacterized protein LOC108364559 isoform X1 [Rhagoletis zephyria]|uniref:uncharacterized protein LOC108364559 isoform X1 n=2 Tax=Rhagoletis zephyria TaxID=28612 RepID=UPI00081162AE|nr:PREDICTED: uncharacterized protein LOC108364559 isoform X1 [Rhagoletis zephyria]XP_017473773.1 PREDICTED: uncharacterized protein LOC108364559 isoform X1 [Rhagoletis zephyria]
MRRIKFILLMVKLYVSVTINYAKIEKINTSIYELIKRRARFMEIVILYKNEQVVMWEYIHLELSTNERTFAPQQNRGSTFWEVECQCSGDNNFRQNFRLNRSAFKKLCSFLDHLKRKATRFHNTICLEKRVAIALYAPGSSAEYRSIANLFGVAKPTLCAALLEFFREVWKVLHPMYFNHFPLSRETIEDCVNGFKHIGFPQCMGALDGCHIEIHPRQEEAVDYINYKGWYSTVLQALVDARYRYINLGSPGRCNDSQIFEKSSLKTELENCSLLNTMSTNLGNFDIPVVILRDSAFRFSKYLMKPFPFSLDKTPSQKALNYQLSKSRRVVENAFGQLKAR